MQTYLVINNHQKHTVKMRKDMIMITMMKER